MTEAQAAPIAPAALPLETSSPRYSRGDLIALGIGMAIVAACVAAVHWPSLSSRAICFDDPQYIVSNKLVRNPGFDSVGRFLSEVLQPSSVQGYYQPLTMISLMIDAAMTSGPADIVPFHRTNLILHVLNTLLVIFLLYLLFGKPLPAILVGLLFGVHPLTVECVAWMSERKTLLATFFALGSLCLYVQFARARDIRWFIAAGAAYFLAMLSKPTAIPLCIFFLLLDYWPLGRYRREAVIEKMPLFALGAVFAALTIVSQGSTAGVGLQGERVLPTVLLIVCHNVVFYLASWVWPIGLTPHYPIPAPFSLSHPMLLAGVLGTFAIVPFLILSLRWTRAFLVGCLIYFAALLPTLQILGFSFVIASDKYAYLPLLGIWMIVCWLIAAAWGSMASGGAAWPKRMAITAAVAFLAFCESAVTRDYLSAWESSETLHRHMLVHAPNSGMITDLLAGDLLSQGKIDEALELQLKAVSLDPNLPVAHFNLGTTLLRKNRIDEAITHYQEAARLKPDYGVAHSMLGRAYALQNKPNEALAAMKKGVEVDPTLAESHYNLATLLANQGKAKEAAEEFVQAIFRRPNYPEAHNNLGSLLASVGNVQKAAENFEQAIRLAPNYLQAHANLARAYDRLGRRTDSLRQYQEVLRLNPKDEQAARAVTALTRILGDRVDSVPSGKFEPQPPSGGN